VRSRGQAADVLDEVLSSLDASPPPSAWSVRADYNLDRMMVHGLRRAAEMEEWSRRSRRSAPGAAMTRGTVIRQRAIGSRGLVRTARGLAAKLAASRAPPGAALQVLANPHSL
jgi:hypothetical protein